MAPHLTKRTCCTVTLICALIAALVAVIVVMWVHYGGTRTGTHRADDVEAIPTKQGVFTSILDDGRDSTSTEGKVYLGKSGERAHPDHNGKNYLEDFVTPIRLNRSSTSEDSATIIHHKPNSYYDVDIEEEPSPPPLRHEHGTGHFRHKQAEEWESQPVYEIPAFGRKIYLHLHQNNKFVSPGLSITHFYKNYSQRRQHDPKLSRCFYTGYVFGDDDSVVSVNLCNGMTGYIQTSEENYYIEPYEKVAEGAPSTFIHKIKKIPHKRVGGAGSGDTVSPDNCGVNGTSDLPPPSHRSRRSPSLLYEQRAKRKTEFFIKVLVVADKGMAGRYGRSIDDLELYILIMMLGVVSVYEDLRIGNHLSLSVVDINILQDHKFPGETPDDVLKHFCVWQRDHRKVKRKHDAALLLTDDDSIEYLGKAYVGKMCDPERSCALIVDRGLGTSYTMAHELGHLLSMPHDDDPQCRQFFPSIPTDTSYDRYIMYQTTNTKHRWSNCSKYYVQQFLRSDAARCLLTPPDENVIGKTSGWKQLLGEMVGLEKQCEYEFGIGYVVCRDIGPPCGKLWCRDKNDDGAPCQTMHMPWAEGTLCGESSWCHLGECSATSRDLLMRVEGGWSSWDTWGECSRTCGGGVQSSRRFCDNPKPQNGGADCVGRNVRYQSCNTAPCDPGAPDFREVQCSHFDGDTKGFADLPSDVKWVHWKDADTTSCRLTCVTTINPAHHHLHLEVLDGTKCGPLGLGICVAQQCKGGGCDNRLGSNLTWDECGVCGGDNSLCEVITGTHNHSSEGYNKVVMIPRGSLNVVIEQRGYGGSSNDRNHLALVDGETGEYILNGNSQISASKEFRYADVDITYNGSASVVERISTKKNQRLSKDLEVELLAGGELLPPDITFRYTINRDDSPRYGWRLYDEEWSPCSALCNGTQQVRPICVDAALEVQVPEQHCTGTPVEQFVLKRSCNTHCQLTWNIRSMTNCSVQCGKGIRELLYNCVKSNITEYDEREESRSVLLDYGNREEVPVEHCRVLSDPPPYESCYSPCQSVRWKYSQWSQCSRSCGGGLQSRQAKCTDAVDRTVPVTLCGAKEEVERRCNEEIRCPVWVAGDWSECSASCGRGFKAKHFVCHDPTVPGVPLPPESCDPLTMPVDRKECSAGRPCVSWTAEPWGKCRCSTTESGRGERTRLVQCRTVGKKIVGDGECRGMLRPSDRGECQCEENEIITEAAAARRVDPLFYATPSLLTGNPDDNSINPVPFRGYQKPRPRYAWATGSWSGCSATCDGGIMWRRVVCRNDLDGQEVEESRCGRLKPKDREVCNMKACLYPESTESGKSEWKLGPWGQCDHQCYKHRTVTCRNIKTGDFIDESKCPLKMKPSASIKCKPRQCPHLNQPSKTKNKYNYYYYDHPQQQSKHQHQHQHRQPIQTTRYKWDTTRFRPCSRTCGQGVRRRTVICMDTHFLQPVADQYCVPQHRKPRQMKQCRRYRCPYVWLEGAWGECSVTCGNGIKQRPVNCHKVFRGEMVDPVPVDGALCGAVTDKPLERTSCRREGCEEVYVWKAGEWKECSAGCGNKGKQKRDVMCVDKRNGRVLPGNYCRKENKPKKKRKCNQVPCIYNSCKEIKYMTKSRENKDYLVSINGKTVSLYCFKMDTPDPEEYISLQTEGRNYAEIYNKRLENIDSCPHNGQRNDDCQCIPLKDERAGFTLFWKVRLNITSLQIIGDDFTFSKQMGIQGDRQVPFGTAGDCYSTVSGCAQGRFSIDLAGTTFKLGRDVRWLNKGEYSTSKIIFTEGGAEGICGGYCGDCVPDPSIGLHVEIT